MSQSKGSFRLELWYLTEAFSNKIRVTIGVYDIFDHLVIVEHYTSDMDIV